MDKNIQNKFDVFKKEIKSFLKTSKGLDSLIEFAERNGLIDEPLTLVSKKYIAHRWNTYILSK